ncbi:hypothetical protein JCM8115_004148 [Rhodotorula mucilaginosa]
MTVPDLSNGGGAPPKVVTTKATELRDPGVAHSATATATEEVKPATARSISARMGTSRPTPVIDSFLTELGCPVLEGRAGGAPSGEESRGRKPMLQSHMDLGTASKSPPLSATALPPISLDSGRPSPRSSFSSPSDYYKFPPAPPKVSSEAIAVVVETKPGPAQTGNGVDVGHNTATSEATVKVSGEAEKPASTTESKETQHPKAAEGLKSEGEGEQQSQPPAPTRRSRDPCRVPYATTCSCELEEDEEIARVKRKAPAPPPVLPRLLLPRAFSILKRCPSCDRRFHETHSERDRVACVMEEHWACVVHLCLTGRIEAAFADE